LSTEPVTDDKSVEYGEHLWNFETGSEIGSFVVHGQQSVIREALAPEEQIVLVPGNNFTGTLAG
jgi:hypothetical protein